jgi:hypothetical protein
MRDVVDLLALLGGISAFFLLLWILVGSNQ